MKPGTHADRIIRLLAETPGLDDDQIAQALSIEPRQSVNQVCRRLAGSGVLLRERGPGGKIVNRLASGAAAAAPDRPARTGRRAADVSGASRPGHSLMPESLERTLLVIPCSGAKQDRAGIGEPGASITKSLPPELARELREARRAIRARAHVDETTLIPAWRRYDGSLYQSGREALADLRKAGAHIIILSGGYGAVLASEPIGMYDAVLKPSWWPGRILERVLIAYARRHGIRSVRAFCSASGPYRTILQRVRWREAGIDDALLLTPPPESGGLVKSPATQGQALTALRDGSLTSGWESSYGLGLDVQQGYRLPGEPERAPYGHGPAGGFGLCGGVRVALLAALVAALPVIVDGDGPYEQPECADAGIAGCGTSECGFDRDHFLLLGLKARPIRAFHAAEEQAGPKTHPEDRNGRGGPEPAGSGCVFTGTVCHCRGLKGLVAGAGRRRREGTVRAASGGVRPASGSALKGCLRWVLTTRPARRDVWRRTKQERTAVDHRSFRAQLAFSIGFAVTRSRDLLRRLLKEHAPDDARQMLAERVVAHLELSGFEIDEADQVMRKRPPTRGHG